MSDASRSSDARVPWLSLAIAVGVVGTAAGMVWAVWHAFCAELGPVELGYWYEASRIRRGLTVFVDPMVGVHDDGPVPITALQTYMPFWGRLLALFPASCVTAVGRLLSTAAWFGGLIGVALAGKPGQRRGALLYAVSYAPLFFLLRSAASAIPDAIAVGFVGAGFALVLRRERVTVVAALLLAAAGLVKPSVVGVFFGVLACDLARGGRRAYGAWAAAATFGGLVLAVLLSASGGVWLAAFRATAQQPIALARYLHYFVEYALFLGVPQLAILGLSHRARPLGTGVPAYATWGLAVGIAIPFIGTGRYGASTNYWLEPVMAACVVLAHGPRIVLPAWARPASPLAPLLLLAVGFGPAREATRSRDEADRRAVARIDGLCENDGTRSWFGIERLELLGTGRIAAFPFGALFMGVRDPHGFDPVRGLLRNPAVSCFVHTGDVRAPFVPTDPGAELPLYDYYLRDTILAELELVDAQEGVYVYRRRAHR